VALFGVLAINLETEFRVSIFAQFLLPPTLTALDAWIAWALWLLLEFKAFALFSLLFGVGLAIQHERLAKNERRGILLVRRMLALLLFGLIHMLLIWNCDILSEYAIAGLIVLPFLYAPAGGLLLGALLCLAFYFCQPWWGHLVPFPTREWIAAHVAAANEAYASGGFSEVFDFRLEELPAILALHAFIFPRTVGLMLLGAFAWRMGLFRRVADLRGWLWLAAGALLAAGVARSLTSEQGSEIAPVLMALSYAGLILLAADGDRRWTPWIAPLGRMAFTNYLLQSIVMGFIFYGYGLGLFGKLSLSTGFALVLAIYAVQIAASRWWLSRFRFGPLEWLWRTLMYGAAPSLLVSRPRVSGP
jgi:uncharacterized protein